MKKYQYIKPQVELVLMEDLMEGDMREGSWGTDGSHTPIKDDEGDDIIIYGKDGSNLWDGWDD